MVNETTRGLLSPPSSPLNCSYDEANPEPESQLKLAPDIESMFAFTNSMALFHDQVSAFSMDSKQRPMLCSNKNFFSLNTDKSHTSQNSPGERSFNTSTTPQRDVSITTAEELESRELSQAIPISSAQASPINGLTPPSTSGGEKGEGKQDDLTEMDFDAENENDDDVYRPESSTELRSSRINRKMKRFRLTHNQTRFLMSEFARQAHPDAAHRDRLSREIPGLSSRQVQVWFQNRRAKLKRLNSDDRERMTRSRAVPEDFDMTRTLHSPFSSPRNGGSPLPSPASFTLDYPEGNVLQPLTFDNIRSVPSGRISQDGINSDIGSFAFTPPQSATDPMFTVASSRDSAPFSYPNSLDRSPSKTVPYIKPSISSPGFISRMSSHDHVSRTRDECLLSPIRDSVPLGETLHDDTNRPEDSAVQPLGNSSYENNLQRSSREGIDDPNYIYNISYSYNQIPGYQGPQRQNTQYSTVRNCTTPQTASFPNYQSSPLGSPQSYHAPHISAQQNVTSFPNSYLRQDQDQGQTESYSLMGSIVGKMDDTNSERNVDNDEILLSQSY